MDIFFNGLLGPVTYSNVISSLMLMIHGMIGIFVVMILIFLVIVTLSKIPDKEPSIKNKNSDEISKNRT